MSRHGEGGATAELASRLRVRREEIEQATLARLASLSPLPDRAGPGYAEGLRAAVAAAVDHAIATLEREDEAAAAVPLPLLTQARLAARSGVGLDTVARRYVAGHSVISDFVLQEAGGGLPADELKRLLHSLGLAVDRLLRAAAAAYTDEVDTVSRSGNRVRVELIERLLAGELLEADALEYDLAFSHLAVLATGSGAGQSLRALARSLDAQLLVASPARALHWAWLGRRRPLDPEDVLRAVALLRPPSTFLALGEVAAGPTGWRLTHRQARAALGVALRGRPGVVRYADVALLAAALQDDLLEASLRRLYLNPLEDDRERGDVLRQTLRAYFAADCNASSAAAALGLSRNTVAGRLREAEERLGRPLSDSRTELDVALRLQESVTNATAAT